MIYTWFADPGHAWLQVNKHKAFDLGLWNKISSYSYQDAHNIYLEEDIDASLFIQAYKAKHGSAPQTQEQGGGAVDNSFVRRLERFTPEAKK
jgi:hypothetical protein